TSMYVYGRSVGGVHTKQSEYIFFAFTRRPPRSTRFPTRRSSDLLSGRRVSGWKQPDRPVAATASVIMENAVLMTPPRTRARPTPDRKSTRLNSSHVKISYAVFCLK